MESSFVTSMCYSPSKYTERRMHIQNVLFSDMMCLG